MIHITHINRSSRCPEKKSRAALAREPGKRNIYVYNRRPGDGDSEVAPVGTRVGLDGKVRHLPKPREKFAALDETPFEGIECEGDDEETCWRRGLLYRATNAAGEAAYEDWARFRVDAELVSAAERAATAWRETAAY